MLLKEKTYEINFLGSNNVNLIIFSCAITFAFLLHIIFLAH